MSNYWRKKMDELENSNNDIAPVQKSNSSDYFKNKMSELGKAQQSGEIAVTPEIAPTTEQKTTWFDKGAFSDGYQAGDVIKTILGTIKDVEENVNTAVVDATENLIDTVASGVGWVGGLFGADKFQDKVGNFIAKDLLKSEKTGEFVSDYLSPAGYVTKLLLSGDDTEDASVLAEKSDGLVQSGAHLAGSYALQMVGVPAWLTMGVNAYGSEIEQAYAQGATHGEASVSGLISAGSEIIFEKLSSGIKILKGTTADEAATKWLSENLSNKVVRTLAKLGMDMAGEGTEEVLTEATSALGRKLTYADEEEWNELFSSEDAFDAFIGGVVMSGAVGGGKAVNSAVTGKDYTSGLTASEETVVKKVFEDRVAEAERDGKKLSNSKKNKIWDEVIKDMDRGAISLDTIEEALGGSGYAEYKSMLDTENSLKEEAEALRDEFNKLNKMKRGEMTGEQIDRLEELRTKLAEIGDKKLANDREIADYKEWFDAEVFDLAKGSRLENSYIEYDNRGKAFQSDLSKYDEKARATVQRAIDSGILNNTNRTHEFVDTVAKLSADKGVPFDFANNAKLKESGFVIDDAVVNGVVTKDGITINIDSPKAWQATVGHEITHVLEGTELYTELQNAIIEYAKAKGDYDARLEKLTKLYANVEGADINAELTADLVGDYLFEDSDFIANLSTQNRNVFQKIYDEIKYLIKLVTAGSKEARQLEAVKKAFDKAYKAGGETSGDTKYSADSENSLDKEAERRYNAYGWASDNHIINAGQRANFDSKFAGVVARGDFANKTKSGEYMIPVSDIYDSANEGVENTIVYAKGTIEEPIITAVVKIDADNETDLSELRRELYEAERRGIQQKIEGVLRRYDSFDFSNARVEQRGQQARSGYNNELGAERRASSGKAARAVSYRTTEKGHKVYYSENDIAPTKVSSKDDAFFDAKNTKYSLSDSDGKTLTNEQNEYFKNSKMRDDNGNLKVMYHGSQDAGFHVFDPAHSDDETSLFFVDRNDVAASYSGTSETYEAKTIRSAEDMNKFLDEIGYDSYKAVKKDGKFELLENNEHVAYSNTAQGLYEEFCWYEGVGEGDANYKVYLNLTNPLEVDAEGRNWNNISREYSQKIADRYNSLTAEEKDALTNLAEWEEYSIFKDEMLDARAAAEQGVSSGYGDAAFTKTLARAYEKLGGANANLYDAFSIASDNFSEDSIREFAVKQMTTRDYAKKAKAEGYDGVIFKNIHDNGGYSNGSEGASTVAVAFSSNQVKSVANENPTKNADIRYSLTEYTAEEKKAHNDAVLNHFGKTYSWAETGYLLLDGTRLDLSGKHDGAPGGYRTVDHRDITEALGYDYGGGDYSGSLVQFMSEGNIRIIPECNGINLSVKPTKAQEQALSNYISRYRGEVMLDIDDLNGNTVVSVEYPYGTYYTKVLNDINEWFDNGKRPENSGTYSLTKSGDTPKKYGDYYTPANELRYEGESIAPVGEDLAGKAETSTTGKSTPTESAVESEFEGVTEDTLPDDFAPITEADADAMRSEIFDSLDDTDVPPEIAPTYYGEEARSTIKLDDKSARTITGKVNEILGLDKSDSARMTELIQRYADGELTESELFDEIGRSFEYVEEVESDEVIKRAKNRMRGAHIFVPADKISEFNRKRKDGYNAFRKEHFGHFYLSTINAPHTVSIDGLYKELNELYPDLFPDDIINNADQLMRMGEVATMTDATVRSAPYDSDTVKEVVDAIRNGVSEYSRSDTLDYLSGEARDSYFESIGATEIAPPVESVSTDIAPPVEDTARTRESERTDAEPPKVAAVMTEEPKMSKEKRSILNKFRTNFLDKGSVIEDLSLKAGNRELDAKYNFMHYSEARAQEYINKNLKPIVDAVEKTGKTQQLYEYAYHLHNIDRMSIENNAQTRIAELRGKFGHLKLEQIKAIAAKEITERTTERTATTIREAKDYLNALDAKNKPVFGDSVTADVSRETVKELERANPEFKEFSEAIVTYNTELRKMLVEGNVISQETADLWAKMYPYYVPIRRLGKDGLGVTVPLDTRKTGINAPIKRATGGDSDILPLFDTMALRTEQTFKAIAKNSFGVELMHTLDSTVESEVTSIEEVLDDFDNHEELLQEGKNGQKPTFTVFENGKRVTFEITEDIYDSLKGTSDGLKYTNKVANVASNAFRGLLTEYNPVFMVNNAIKDAQDVLINSQHPAKTYATIPEAIKELTTKGKWYAEYVENGGTRNTYFDSDSKTFKKENKGFVKAVGMPLRAISEANNFIERVPRLAEYIASRKAGASVEVAMLDAARITTNFAAGGDVTKFLNRNGATFLNASVQGFNQQFRNVREAKANGAKGWLSLAAKVAIAGLPAVLLNNLLWDDDEDYEELSDYVKDGYYIVAKTEDGTFIRIPKGRTVAVIQNAFEQMDNLITGDDELDFGRFNKLFWSNLAPQNPIDNNILSPIIDVKKNETWYGEDLVPTRLQDLPAAEQYDESTDKFSKWIGETFNVSPYKVNYLLDQYSGGVGDVVLPYFTPEADGDGILAPFKDKFTTDSVMNNQNVGDFYDTVDELTANAKSSKATDEDVLKYKYMNSINAELSELYQQKREIQNSDISDKEKSAAVREIQAQIVSLTRDSLNTYENVNIDGVYASVGDRHFKLNDEGEWQKLSGDQLEKQEKVTKGLGISASEYWSNKEEYDFAYEKPDKYTVAKALGGYSAYKSYSSELYDIKADKDSSGKSITGSRKEKVIEYVNNLDIDYGARLILFKSEYNADDTYNYEIIDYLNSRQDISYKEMETILKELGFTVDSDGNITWD